MVVDNPFNHPTLDPPTSIHRGNCLSWKAIRLSSIEDNTPVCIFRPSRNIRSTRNRGYVIFSPYNHRMLWHHAFEMAGTRLLPIKGSNDDTSVVLTPKITLDSHGSLGKAPNPTNRGLNDENNTSSGCEKDNCVHGEEDYCYYCTPHYAKGACMMYQKGPPTCANGHDKSKPPSKECLPSCPRLGRALEEERYQEAWITLSFSALRKRTSCFTGSKTPVKNRSMCVESGKEIMLDFELAIPAMNRCRRSISTILRTRCRSYQRGYGTDY
ncbi:DUF3467 domain-containing protein [Sesbania bispinosa]|nr:DUF3467 domain-containing protein [Sesbania bispinosa]